MLKSEPGRQVWENLGVGEDSWAMDFPKKVLCIKNSLPHLAREEKWTYCFSCQTNAKEINSPTTSGQEKSSVSVTYTPNQILQSIPEKVTQETWEACGRPACQLLQ